MNEYGSMDLMRSRATDNDQKIQLGCLGTLVGQCHLSYTDSLNHSPRKTQTEQIGQPVQTTSLMGMNSNTFVGFALSNLSDSHDRNYTAFQSIRYLRVRMNSSNVYALARMSTQGDFRPVLAGMRILKRGQWVVCRSAFGLELAEILSESQSHPELATNNESFVESAAQWVRDATSQDHWLWEKLQRINQSAVGVCQDFLNQQNCNDTLLEIASSIDGKSVAFEFLGQASQKTNSHLEQLSEIYQACVRESEIYKQIEVGCGPGCGTTASCGSATGHSHSCQSCAISGRCKKG